MSEMSADNWNIFIAIYVFASTSNLVKYIYTHIYIYIYIYIYKKKKKETLWVSGKYIKKTWRAATFVSFCDVQIN